MEENKQVPNNNTCTAVHGRTNTQENGTNVLWCTMPYL